MRVAFFPQWHENPYLDLLGHGLAEKGIEVIWDVPQKPNLHWLRANRMNLDVLHIHWPEDFYQSLNRSRAVRAVLVFIANLLIARKLGFGIVWTVHNIHSHLHRYRVLDFMVWQALALLAHAAFVHCYDTKSILARRFWRHRNVYVVPIGNYIGVHGQPVEKRAARQLLGLPLEKTIHLFIGYVKPYKGIEGLLEAFGRVTSDELMLVIAGRPEPPYFTTLVEQLVAAEPRSRAYLRWLDKDEVSLFLSACDVVTLPFHRVQTSSSAVLAMSYGRAVLAPVMGCLPELVDDSAGFLYDSQREDGLERAIANTLHADLEKMGSCGFEKVQQLTWSSIARVTLQAYQQACKHL
jgi:beta-1,4-mannosyltransferase